LRAEYRRVATVLEPAVAAPPIAWVGPLRDPSGHADEARGFLRALERAGLAPSALELSWMNDNLVELAGDDDQMLERQLRRKLPADGVAVHHYLPHLAQPTVEGRLNVARAMFETDTLPPSWLEPLLERDAVWVPCEHNFDAFRRGGVPAHRLRVVGGTLDFDLFAPGAEPLALPGEGFRFLSNFDFSERKGWRQLLTAWGQAFGAGEGVCLILKTSSYYREASWVQERVASFLRERFGPGWRERLAPIHVVTEMLDAADLPRLYAGADAYVLPSRGEGWGRPFMEAMAMGLPTVASRYGGPVDFMDDRHSWLVDGRLVDVPKDAELFNGLYRGHRWFEADIDALAAILREIAGDPGAARLRAAGARTALIERFGPQAIAETVAEAANDLVERHGGAVGARPLCALRGDFGSNASLSIVNDELAQGLAARGHSVLRRIRGAEPLVETCPGITHGWPADFIAPTGGPTVAILPWEFGDPPAEWVDQARRRLDRIWVPSAYVRDGFVAGGMPPGIVDVVPNGVDLQVFTPDGPRLELPAAGCTFLYVGGTTWRKGADLLLEAWQRAFGPRDDVALVIKDFGIEGAYRGQTGHDLVRAFVARDDLAPIHYLPDEVDPSELPALYRAADVLVAPYRAEGFGLPILEAMACGLAVIHPDHGPSIEFAGPDCGWTVPAHRGPLPPEAGRPELTGPGWMHQVGVDDLVAALRAAAADPAERARRGSAAVLAAGELGWERTAETAERSLRSIVEEDLPVARAVEPVTLPSRGATIVAAPDFAAGDGWRSALACWARAFGPDDPVTLVIHARDVDLQEAATVIGAALQDAGVPDEELPDLALCGTAQGSLVAVVAGAAGVLVDGVPGVEPAAALVRRAARVVSARPSELAALRAEILSQASG
jgi:glycosyltransferase involved in cell wall biosynthesis